MLRTKNIITRFEELDEEWAFEYYLKSFGLDQKLEGQSINIHTPFQDEDTPSFFLFNEGRYFFKCFATNRGGDVYEMVKHIFNFPTKAEAITRVWNDYEEYLNGSGKTWHTNNYSAIKYQKKVRYHMKGVEMRGWNEDDKKFWSKYHITRVILEEHNVAALDKIIMSKVDNTGTSDFTIQNPLMYGFFKKNGELYKCYQPGRKKGKYLRVRDYLQGIDQLDPNNKKLLITKALKDIMGFKALKIAGWNCVAPNSENELLSEEVMQDFKNQYTDIRTLFDNDTAGETARTLYKEKFGLESLDFNLGQKDLTDSTASVGYKSVQEKMVQLLN